MNDQNVTVLLNSYYDHLNSTERQIADFIIKDPQIIMNESISSVAKALGFSPATITRFIKHLDFNSYREFRNEIVRLTHLDSTENSEFPELQGNSLKAVATKVGQEASNAILQTINLTSEEHLNEIVDNLINANRVGFFGMGGSAIVALDAYHKFMRTGINCSQNLDFDLQLMQAAQMNENDLGVVISHTGRNKQTEMIIDTLSEHHVKVLILTSFANAPLAKKADLKLVAVSEETKLRTEGLTSQIVQMSLVEMLFLMVLQKTNQSLTPIRQVINKTRIN